MHSLLARKTQALLHSAASQASLVGFWRQEKGSAGNNFAPVVTAWARGTHYLSCKIGCPSHLFLLLCQHTHFGEGPLNASTS